LTFARENHKWKTSIPDFFFFIFFLKSVYFLQLPAQERCKFQIRKQIFYLREFGKDIRKIY
jgi:hypothetical protein